MMAQNNQNKKIAEACKSLSNFGFPEEKVKATLSRLVKLYNNEWKFIEEENYRQVIDMLMEENEEGVKKAKLDLDREANLHDEKEETESPMKRCLKGQYDHQASSSVVNFPNKRAKTLHYALEKGKNLEFPEVFTGRKTSHFEKDEDNVEGGVSGVSNSSQLDIASSANEEVKISLICSFSGDSCFRSRSLDAILGDVEDECRRTYEIQDPTFSLTKVMEKVCQYFLKVDSDSNNKSLPLVLDTSKKPGAQHDYQGNPTVQSNHLNEVADHPDIVEGVNDATEKKIKMLKDDMEAVLQKGCPIYIKDIARGEENVQIPLVNEGIALELPDFMYIKNNMVHNGAHIDFSLARISEDNCCAQCHGDCLSSALPCACAGEMRGEFVYTQEGLLKEEFLDECIAMCWNPERKYTYYCEICPLENNQRKKGKRIKPCKGHLTRKFIKECWRKCGCNKKCGNRVVQRGIQVALQLFATAEGKGWGIRSVHALKKGTFICEYAGEIVTNQELDERNSERAAKQEKHTYPVLLDADWGSERILKDDEALCLDATEFGNIGRFINHRCDDANLIEIPVEVETPDHHYYRVAFFTTRDIEPMEELTWDYGIQFEDKYHPIKAFKCRCGSTKCRDKKRSH